ncbi:MAG: hypothetical protein J0H01_30600 [Rhizobiales bacterium]|nr:hypothetical protein [Hyphomicrobiales bacterium]
MPIMMMTRPVVGAALGALALGFVLAIPATDARAAEQQRDRATAGTTTGQAPIEMQRRGFSGGRGFAGAGIRPGAFTGARGGYVRPGGGWGGGPRWRGGYYGGGGWYGPGPWAGAAAAGLIIGGAAIASQPYYYRDCWVERRWVERWDGYAVPRDVRVCR